MFFSDIYFYIRLNTNMKLLNYNLNKILELIFVFIYVIEIIFSSNHLKLTNFNGLKLIQRDTV